MAAQFIGSIVTVTLHQPSNAQVRGLVKGITEGQRIDLKDGELPDPHNLNTALIENIR